MGRRNTDQQLRDNTDHPGSRGNLIKLLIRQGFDSDIAGGVADDIIAEWREAEKQAELWLRGVPVPEPDPDVLQVVEARLKEKAPKEEKPDSTSNTSAVNKLIAESLAIEAESAQQAGTLGYMARALVQATMPHSKQSGSEFTRTNGAFTLSLLAPSMIGLPYGALPRLLVAWVTTEAVRTKERRIILGDHLSQFMSILDLVPTGGRWGTVTRLKEQMKRLFASSVSCTYDGGRHWALTSVKVIEDADLWWDPQRPEQAALWESSLTIGEKFFEEVTQNPIPVDMRALKALRRSPMALDIYAWLTYRMSYLNRSTVIPWEALQMQFGAEYKLTRQFKAAFLKHLKTVLALYPEAKANEHAHGLELRPSVPHIPKS